MMHSGFVEIPLIAVAPILICEFPLFERNLGAFFEALELLVRGDVKPEFKHDGAIIGELRFKLVDFAVRPLQGVLTDQAFGPFNQHPAALGPV